MKAILLKKLDELSAEVIWGGSIIVGILSLIIVSATIARIIRLISDIITSFS